MHRSEVDKSDRNILTVSQNYTVIGTKQKSSWTAKICFLREKKALNPTQTSSEGPNTSREQTHKRLPSGSEEVTSVLTEKIFNLTFPS